MPSTNNNKDAATKRRIALQKDNNGGGNRMLISSHYKESCELIDLSSYREIRVDDNDDDKSIVICQVKVTMEQLVRYTVQYQRIPKVVAEFRNISVGGAISGAAVESTSHSYGLFMDTVLWVKVMKGDGQVQKVYRGDPLWCGLSGTYGSIGIVLEAAIECVPLTSPFVSVSYHAFESSDAAIKAMMDTVHKNKHVFLDGLVFPLEQIQISKSKADGKTAERATVVIEGETAFGNFEGTLSKRKIGWQQNLSGGSFFYEHVHDLIANHRFDNNFSGPIHTELIPIEDYLFRYDYGAFWMARPMTFKWPKFFSYSPFILGLFIASFRWTRIITGSLFTTKNLFRMLKCVPDSVIASKMVVQDCFIPPKMAHSFLSWVHSTIPLSTPIWLCPVRINKDQPFTPSYHAGGETVLLNCAIYGRVSDGCGAEYTRHLEAKCQEVGGRKMMYAQNHFSEDTFWKIFDKSAYDQLRREYSAEEAFPSMYEKTCGVPEPKNSLFENIISLFL
jgi:hypothetical protein